MRIAVSNRAHLDVAETVIWYERAEPGAGTRFFAALEETYLQIANSPDGYPEVEPGIRRRTAQPYPYVVYYRAQEDSILILRVIHGHRHPDTWREEA